ncbi:hypothetical protein C493_13363 [Natronolimnohabitans innermongolicus JCM 12255]|uniref:Uncharacterized protein n=1 Tax=Natronolimnohabitans innermongolicus JCM 12255 TaxID=1227499 RepID=L9WY04_9EURY|nr:hypothetical protein C493_13363 [Natronolimnohabitans innermongolicus JCM 12255]
MPSECVFCGEFGSKLDRAGSERQLDASSRSASTIRATSDERRTTSDPREVARARRLVFEHGRWRDANERHV